MRILWHSNAPWAPTGYGNQTKVFCPRISELGHELAISAFYGLIGGVLHWNAIRIYPKGFTDFGQDVISAHGAHFKADAVITLMDAWVVEPEMFVHPIPWIPWFPVDMEPIPQAVLRKISQAYARIVFSKFGEKMVHQAGLDCYYVPHGVDTKVFKPADQKTARENMKLPQDKFIVGMVAANKGKPSRKAFSENLQAFANFHRRHRDTLLYLHTTKEEQAQHGGMNIPEYCKFLGLKFGNEAGSDVMIGDQYAMLLGVLDEGFMANLYNTFDVLNACSMGEGFGIPTVEAQACGIPVIVGDWTASGELCFSGWKIPKKESAPWWTPIAGYQFMPRIGAIEEALENAYQMKGNQDYKKRARKGALPYDADRITKKYWKPVLSELEERIENDDKTRRTDPGTNGREGIPERTGTRSSERNQGTA